MDEVPSQAEIILALQKHPETLAEVLDGLTTTTVGRWEKLGKLLFRRRATGQVAAWAFETDRWYSGLEIVGADAVAQAAPQWRASNQDEAMSQADAALLRMGCFLIDHSFPHPVTETMVWRAVGLERPDLFALRQVRHSLRDHQRAQATPGPITGLNGHALVRHTGRSTTALVSAITLMLNGGVAVVVVPDPQRLQHMRRLLTTLTQPLDNMEPPSPSPSPKPLRSGEHFRLLHRVSGGEVRLYSINDLARSWHEPRTPSPAMPKEHRARWFFHWD